MTSDVNTAKESRTDLHFFRHTMHALCFNFYIALCFQTFPCIYYNVNNTIIASARLKLISEHPFDVIATT